jgi:hypothetical protein
VGVGGREKVLRKEGRRVSMMQKLCTHECKSKKKMVPVETIPGMEVGVRGE